MEKESIILNVRKGKSGMRADGRADGEKNHEII